MSIAETAIRLFLDKSGDVVVSVPNEDNSTPPPPLPSPAAETRWTIGSTLAQTPPPKQVEFKPTPSRPLDAPSSWTKLLPRKSILRKSLSRQSASAESNALMAVHA